MVRDAEGEWRLHQHLILQRAQVLSATHLPKQTGCWYESGIVPHSVLIYVAPFSCLFLDLSAALSAISVFLVSCLWKRHKSKHQTCEKPTLYCSLVIPSFSGNVPHIKAFTSLVVPPPKCVAPLRTLSTCGESSGRTAANDGGSSAGRHPAGGMDSAAL